MLLLCTHAEGRAHPGGACEYTGALRGIIPAPDGALLVNHHENLQRRVMPAICLCESVASALRCPLNWRGSAASEVTSMCNTQQQGANYHKSPGWCGGLVRSSHPGISPVSREFNWSGSVHPLGTAPIAACGYSREISGGRSSTDSVWSRGHVLDVRLHLQWGARPGGGEAARSIIRVGPIPSQSLPRILDGPGLASEHQLLWH